MYFTLLWVKEYFSRQPPLTGLDLRRKEQYDKLKHEEQKSRGQVSALQEDLRDAAALKSQMMEHSGNFSAFQHQLHQQLCRERATSRQLARLLDATVSSFFECRPFCLSSLSMLVYMTGRVHSF